MQQRNKQAEQEGAQLTPLLCARHCGEGVPKLPIDCHLTAHPIIQRHQHVQKGAMHTQLSTSLQQQVPPNLVKSLLKVHKDHIQATAAMLRQTDQMLQREDGI
jgi:hypothetical protein